MNWNNLEIYELELIGLRLYYNSLDFNWLELGCVFEVPSDDICCGLALYKQNRIENGSLSGSHQCNNWSIVCYETLVHVESRNRRRHITTVNQFFC